MPSLSLIEAEAQRLLRHLPDPRRNALQSALLELCEAHWHELHGPEPVTTLAHVLWTVRPPLADLFVDLHATGDGRLHAVLQDCTPAQGLALLVLAEIDHGNAEEVYITHEPMMAFESMATASVFADRIRALLHGKLLAPAMHHHDSHPPLWRALAVISAHIGRHDLAAVLAVIGLLAAIPHPSSQAHDEALENLRAALTKTGVQFLGIDDDHVLLQQHGHQHKPVRTRQLGDMLREIRQSWLDSARKVIDSPVQTQ